MKNRETLGIVIVGFLTIAAVPLGNASHSTYGPHVFMSEPKWASWHQDDILVTVEDTDYQGNPLPPTGNCKYVVNYHSSINLPPSRSRTCNSSFLVTVGPGPENECREQTDPYDSSDCSYIVVWNYNANGEPSYSHATWVRLDWTPPNTNFYYIENGEWRGQDFTVRVREQDQQDLYFNDGFCEYKIVSSGVATVPWTQRPCESNYIGWISVISGPDGDCQAQGINVCTIHARARDSAGNQGDAETVTLSIEWTPPVTDVTVSGNQGDNDWYVSPVEVQLECNDSQGLYSSGCDWLSYWTSGDWAELQRDDAFVRTETDGDGFFDISYRSYDNAENREENEGSRSVKVDASLPTSSISAPADGTVVTTPYVDVTFFDSDVGPSGLASCHYLVKGYIKPLSGPTWIPMNEPLPRSRECGTDADGYTKRVFADDVLDSDNCPVGPNAVIEAKCEITSYARDAAGNESPRQTITVYVQ